MKKTGACPSAQELSRAYSVGASADLAAHLKQCPRCAERWGAIERVVALGRNLPDQAPSAERVRVVRDAIMRDAAAQKPEKTPITRPVWAASAVAASICLILGAKLIVGIHKRTDQPKPVTAVLRATVHPHAGAGFIRVGRQPDEIVRLTRGTITVEVASLLPGERFRVVTGDAEVEVRGTVFDATARDDSLVAVKVISGKVKLSGAGPALVLLGPSDRWTKPDELPRTPPSGLEERSIFIEKSPSPASPVTPVVHTNGWEKAALRQTGPRPTKVAERHESAPGATGLEPRPAEIAFNQGWNALRSGDALAAAKTFERAIQAAGSDPIAEDAGFWRAISYQRAGKNLEALGALKLFLSRFPGSQRVGEASVMLGWEFFKFGELEDAKLYFRAALADRVSAVRQSARKGLQAIDTRAAQAAYNNR